MSHFAMDWSELSLQLMMTFGHFLWQGCIVAMLLASVEQLSSIVSRGAISGRAQALQSHPRGKMTPDGLRRSAHLCYVMACIAFFSLPVCVVATCGWVHQSRGPILLAANDSVESPVVSAGIADIPAQPLSHTNVPMLPPVETHAAAEMPAAERPEAPSLAAPSPSWEQRTQLLAPYLLIAYAIGVGLMLARFGLAMIGSTRLRRTLQPITDSALLKIIAEQSTLLGLKRVPIVALCQRISVPVVVGILKPAILLPPALLCGLNPHQLAAILSHEMAHIRRYDLLVNLLQRLVEALLFFHPATWLISRQISNERENCCDDMAAACARRLPYANALLQMAELCIGSDRRRRANLATLSADGGNTTDFGDRIRRLIGAEESPRIGLTRRSFSVGLAMISLLMISLAAWGQSGNIADAKHEEDIQWSEWGDKDGLLSGARLILPEGGLKSGQPLVVEYRLANVSTETKTLKCYLNDGLRFTSLGRGNHIGSFSLDWHRDLVTLTIKSGDVYIDTEHLVSINTTGLNPGRYHAALGSAFHYPDEAESNITHEIPHRGSIPFDIVGESRITLHELPRNDIHWGLPIAGLQLGAKFNRDPNAFAVGSKVEADLFVANVTDQSMECSVVLPHPGDGWLFNVEDANGSTIMLERRPPIDFFSPERFVHLKLAPGETAPITGDGLHVSHSSTPADDNFESSLPRVQFEVVGSENEAKEIWRDYDANGIHGRLVSHGGSYSTIFHVTLQRPDIPAFRLELDSGDVPFSVVGPDGTPIAGADSSTNSKPSDHTEQTKNENSSDPATKPRNKTEQNDSKNGADLGPADPSGDDPNVKNIRTLQFKLIDGANGTPLQGVECTANISQNGDGIQTSALQEQQRGNRCDRSCRS